jgi:DnaA family protein
MLTSQLTLGVRLRDDATFENFYVGKNQQLLSALHHCLAGEGEQFIYLWGATGSGRSHLLQACCHAASESNLSVAYLPLMEFTEFSPQFLDSLETLNLVCIDDVDAISKNAEWEEALFHLYNRIQTTKTRLLVTARAAPLQTEFALADLSSRLSFGVTFQLHSLTDDEKLSALQLRAKLRGLHLSEEVGHFLLQRCSRDVARLLEILEQLDQASLATQRRLTVPFVKSVLLI